MAQNTEQQYGLAIRADLLGEMTNGGLSAMGNLIRLRRLTDRERLIDLRKKLVVRGCSNDFLSTAYEIYVDALQRIASANDELNPGKPGEEKTTPEIILLGFALYHLRSLRVDPTEILESVIKKLRRARQSYRTQVYSDAISANNLAASHSLPRRKIIEQILRSNGDDLSQAIANRSRWLREWRQRLGISQVEAARILGYRSRRQIGEIERYGRTPAWEKIFIAIATENARAACATREGE